MDQERERIRLRSRQGSDETRLLKKGKRGVLRVIYGRTILILGTLALQKGQEKDSERDNLSAILVRVM